MLKNAFLLKNEKNLKNIFYVYAKRLPTYTIADVDDNPRGRLKTEFQDLLCLKVKDAGKSVQKMISCEKLQMNCMKN